MEDASSWALAKGMASGTPAQPATQGNATNARERRVKPVERQMRDIYRKVRPCFNALCTLSEDGRRLASSAVNLFPRMVGGSSSDVKKIGVLAYFGEIRERLAEKHVESMETLIANFRKNFAELGLLVEEVNRIAGEGFKVFDMATLEFTIEELCCASHNAPSLEQRIIWLELIVRSFRKEQASHKSMLQGLQQYDSSTIKKALAASQFINRSELEKIFQVANGRMPFGVNSALLK
ncbi:hypothetical protein AAMO2058_000486800 [Amorphochlora amoebiformis]